MNDLSTVKPASPDLVVAQLVIQNQQAHAALASLVAAVKATDNGDVLADTIAQADQVLGTVPDLQKASQGVPDFTTVVQLIGPHSGWRIKNALDEAFIAGLEQEMRQLLPTITQIAADSDLENGDEGQCFASFCSATITFRDGTTKSFCRDNDGDDEFALNDDDQNIRYDLELLSDEEREEAQQEIEKYAAMFGVEPTQEAIGECLDHISNYISSYYEHFRRDGGLDVVYSI